MLIFFFSATIELADLFLIFFFFAPFCLNVDHVVTRQTSDIGRALSAPSSAGLLDPPSPHFRPEAGTLLPGGGGVVAGELRQPPKHGGHNSTSGSMPPVYLPSSAIPRPVI